MREYSRSWWRRNAVALAAASAATLSLTVAAPAAYANDLVDANTSVKQDVNQGLEENFNPRDNDGETPVSEDSDLENPTSSSPDDDLGIQNDSGSSPTGDKGNSEDIPGGQGSDELPVSPLAPAQPAGDDDSVSLLPNTPSNSVEWKPGTEPPTNADLLPGDDIEGSEEEPGDASGEGEGDSSDEGETSKPGSDGVWVIDPETDEKHYYVDGELAEGWLLDTETNTFQYFEGGVISTVPDGWHTVDGELVYFVDGEKTDPNQVFYDDLETGKRYWYENGERVSSHAFYDPVTDEWYWADADGSIARDKDVWIPRDESNPDPANGKWVRVGADYVMVKGEQYTLSRDDDKWHWWYFDLITGEMAKSFNYIVDSMGKGKWVYYDDIMGWMVYGEQYRPSSKTDSQLHWYYFDDYTGATTYRWKYIASQNKTVYYDDVMGWMVYRWRYIQNSGKGVNTDWHYFDRYTGALMTENDRGNAAHDSYVNIQGGSSKTSYYIVVDKDNFRTVIFQWGGNDWDVAKVFKCGLGAPNANNGRGTQEGFWYLGENIPAGHRVPDEMWRANYDRMYDDTSSGVKYRVHYIWDQGFHSTVYTSSIPPEQQLERYISDGCVRLLESDAKWLYDHCGNGTRVYIFRRY